MTARSYAVPLLVALVLIPLSRARADTQLGTIDWTTRTIKCKGEASPNPTATNISQARIGAERAAKLDALRNILETLKGVTISGSRTIGDAMQDPGVASKVQGIVQNFRVTDVRYFSDGGIEVDVEMKLDGLLGALVPPGTVAPSGAAKSATGVVVDARTLSITPALAPKILDENGMEVYGPNEADPTQVKYGLAAYANDVGAASKDPRVGTTPAVVKGISVARGAPSDVVISNDDARKAREARLANGNVIIVVPPASLMPPVTVKGTTP